MMAWGGCIPDEQGGGNALADLLAPTTAPHPARFVAGLIWDGPQAAEQGCMPYDRMCRSSKVQGHPRHTRGVYCVGYLAYIIGLRPETRELNCIALV